MTNFESKKSFLDVDVIYVRFPCVNFLFWDLNELMMIWDVVEMMLFYDLSWLYVEIMRLKLIWFFGELFARIQDVRMSCYAYWAICGFMSIMNVLMVNLWYYKFLECWDWWMTLWWRIILIWMIITCMHRWMTLHVSRDVCRGC